MTDCEPIPRRTPVEVTISADIDRRRDLDNVIKPVIDLLQSTGILPDDRWVDSICATRVSSLKNWITVDVIRKPARRDQVSNPGQKNVNENNGLSLDG